MYRKYDAAERASLLEQLNKQLDNLESVCVGPYIAGPEITTGDSALMPTFVFLTYILPKYFGWRDVFAGRPKLAAWWQHMQQDPHAERVSACRCTGQDRICSLVQIVLLSCLSSQGAVW